MAISKLILNGDVQMDVTSDTVSASRLLNGYTATKSDGTKVTGNIATKSAADLTFASTTGTFTTAAGYYGAATTKTITTKAAATYNTSTADQTIGSYQWLTGTQTIKSVTTSNLTAANVASGVVVKVGDANNASRITQVTGTYAPAVSSVTVTETQQTFNATGVYGYKPVVVNGISSTYVGTGIARKSSADTTFASATGTFTAPIGYYSAAGTKTITTQAAQTFYPSTADQTVASYRWLTGTQTIKSVTTTNLTAANIVSGTVVKVGDTANASRVTQVTGTFSGIIPTGTSTITSNGTYDVKAYASANVDVSATPNPGLYVTPNYDSGWYLSDSGVYVTAIPYVSEEEWEEKYETDVLMTSNSTSHSASTHETTATIILNNNISNGKGFICLLEVFYGEVQQDYIWLWSDNITIGTTQLNFQSMLDIATVKRASFTNANTLQIVFDWQNVYQGVNGIDDFFGNRFSSGVTINENLDGCRGIVVQPPSGTEQITENGSYNVKWYESVSVNVSGGGGFTADQIATRDISGSISGSASFIGSSAFFSCRQLTSAYFPNATIIYSDAFNFCENLASVSFPSLVTIGNGAFRYCHSLPIISFPEVTFISSYAFTNCIDASIINLPKLISIEGAVFVSCNSLTSVNFPTLSIVGGTMFGSCQNLSFASFPEASIISGYAFASCSQLVSVYIPKANIIRTSAFYGCSKLSEINFPLVTSIETSAFGYCPSLVSVNIPEVTTLSSYAFNYCSYLSTISLPKISLFNGYAFNKCTRLVALHLENVSSVPVLSSPYVFSSTPLFNYSTIAGQWGSIFVPASLYASFQTAANWSSASIQARLVSV